MDLESGHDPRGEISGRASLTSMVVTSVLSGQSVKGDLRVHHIHAVARFRLHHLLVGVAECIFQVF